MLDEAHHALREAVLAVPADGWNLATPCEHWTVTQVLQHAAGDQLGFASVLTGEPGPTEDPFAPSGQLTVEPIAVLDPTLQASAAAWASLGDDATEAPTPLPHGVLPIRIAVGACALDAAVHAWDIAVATGQPSPLSPTLARELMVVATEIVEPLRQYGAYAPALPAGQDDDDVATLLRYLGRRPNWRS